MAKSMVTPGDILVAKKSLQLRIVEVDVMSYGPEAWSKVPKKTGWDKRLDVRTGDTFIVLSVPPDGTKADCVLYSGEGKIYAYSAWAMPPAFNSHWKRMKGGA